MTEKNYNPEQEKAMTMNKQGTTKMKAEAPVKHDDKKAEEVKEEKKKTIVKKEIVKKDEAIVNGVSVPISTKDAVFICKFIKRKSIDKALADLDDVMHFKRAIPMTGEIPHRKGKGMMSGRYPINAVKEFIILLKTLKANANVNGVEEPIIVEAVPNKASQPFGRMGAIRRKRTHVKIRVVGSEQVRASSDKVRREKNKLKKEKKK